MTASVTLTSCAIDPALGIQRETPRPQHLRNETYATRFDWDTVFYDVYRAGKHVVFQGPPLLNLFDHLAGAAPLRGAFGFPRFRARHFSDKKRGEIWLKSDADRFHIDCPLGQFDITVQPDMAHIFAGRRVITTLSKDNDLRWIGDWTRFYARLHGADGVLVYDNGSSAYGLDELQATLEEAVPGMAAMAVSWPFPYGPQGGLAGAVNGVETDWDSDFCQTGSLQHARFRFLRDARSVLNVDIDELVLSKSGASIFAATENSKHGFTKFAGCWIGTYAPGGTTRETCRHADFTFRDLPDVFECPPKWCVAPAKGDRRSYSWSVHNLFGARANRVISSDFTYRHMRAITNSWKEDRWAADGNDPASLPHDTELAAAFAATGLARSVPELDEILATKPGVL